MESKYKFTHDDDLVTLSYKDKKFEFKANVKLTKEIEEIIAESRLTMLENLSKKGISVKSLTIVTVENGKRYEDNSNLEEMEEHYRQKAIEKFLDNKSLELFKMDLESLMVDIGLETENEGLKFASDFMLWGSGNFPSENSNKEAIKKQN